MKRYGNLYKQIYDYNNLVNAHKNASRHKSWYKSVREVNKDPDKYIKDLQDMLINHTYHTSEYRISKINDGKKERVIYKLPYYPDRICQWAIVQIIEPIFMKNLIYNTYSAIPGRGIHQGVRRLKKELSHHPEECTYCLKMDIKKYYPSIDHDILKNKMRRIFKDKELIAILDEIIDSADHGIPIGNYLSQWFGNIYMSSADHYCKEVLHVKHYHRNMDDVVILSESKEFLHFVLNEFTAYCEKELKLTVKDNYQIFPTFVRGIDFLGYRFFDGYTLLRKSTAKEMKKKMHKLENKHTYTTSDMCTIASYSGWLKHCNSFRLRNKYISKVKGRVIDANHQRRLRSCKTQRSGNQG